MITVAVPTYQRADSVERVVRAALADPAVGQVVVAVDGSTDGTQARLAALAAADGRVEVVETDRQGEQGARGAALERATGDVVLFLDDDVVPGPGLASGHAAAHAAGGEGLVVVGHMPVREHGGALDRVTQRLYQRYYEDGCRGWERSPDTILLQLWAGNVSLRREDALRAGFTVRGVIRGQGADRETGLRLHRAGLRGVFDRALEAEHHYERPLGKFFADAEGSGRNEVLIDAANPDLFPPPSPPADAPRRPPLGSLVTLGRRPRARPAVVAALAALTRAAAAAGQVGVAQSAADAAVAILRRHGALEALRDVAR